MGTFTVVECLQGLTYMLQKLLTLRVAEDVQDMSLKIINQKYSQIIFGWTIKVKAYFTLYTYVEFGCNLAYFFGCPGRPGTCWVVGGQHCVSWWVSLFFSHTHFGSSMVMFCVCVCRLMGVMWFGCLRWCCIINPYWIVTGYEPQTWI